MIINYLSCITVSIARLYNNFQVRNNQKKEVLFAKNIRNAIMLPVLATKERAHEIHSIDQLVLDQFFGNGSRK